MAAWLHLTFPTPGTFFPGKLPSDLRVPKFFFLPQRDMKPLSHLLNLQISTTDWPILCQVIFKSEVILLLYFSILLQHLVIFEPKQSTPFSQQSFLFYPSFQPELFFCWKKKVGTQMYLPKSLIKTFPFERLPGLAEVYYGAQLASSLQLAAWSNANVEAEDSGHPEAQTCMGCWFC